jgi:DNA replication and repair protein RecF
MHLTRLQIKRFRTIHELVLEPAPRFNFLSGPNGVGKTSILEAIHCLSTAHSFRTRDRRTLIERDQGSTEVDGQVQMEAYSASMHFAFDSSPRFRFNGKVLSNIITVTRLLPVRAIHPDVDRLISGSPENRRRFLDWGILHTHPEFFSWYQRYKKILSQRNAHIKASYSGPFNKTPWDNDFLRVGRAIDQSRKESVAQIDNVFHTLYAHFTTGPRLSLVYRDGFNRKPDESWEMFLKRLSKREADYRTTQFGPHRGDLVVYVDDTGLARDVLSRGQLKIVLLCLYLAQLDRVKQQTGKKPILLVDDPAAEFDAPTAHRLFDLLGDWSEELQVFFTSSHPIAHPLLERSDIQRYQLRRDGFETDLRIC